MTTFTKPTGNVGQMRVDDDGVNIDLYLLGVNELITQVPWTVTLNGAQQSWKSFRLEANVAWQKVATLFANQSQTLTFHLGASGNVKLGGPTNFDVEIDRGELPDEVGGRARVVDAGVNKPALVWLKDQGEWKITQPWAKKAGLWKPSSY